MFWSYLEVPDDLGDAKKKKKSSFEDLYVDRR